MFSSNPVQLHDELNGNAIHRLENILTLEGSIHPEFDGLYIWFKPVDVCLRPVSCTLIEICYRILLTHAISVLEMVLGGYLVDYCPIRSPSQPQMRDFGCLRDTISNSMHCAVR
jgi:hypothetical protein